MGVFAQTTAVITAKTKKDGKKIYKILKELSEKRDENGNFDFAGLSYEGNLEIYIEHSSGRIQNLEWQMEEVWEKIKHLSKNMSAPFLIEGEGCYFMN